jgi:hypothetical protein
VLRQFPDSRGRENIRSKIEEKQRELRKLDNATRSQKMERDFWFRFILAAMCALIVIAVISFLTAMK